MQTAIAALQNVLSEDFKATEIEVRPPSLALLALLQPLIALSQSRDCKHRTAVATMVAKLSHAAANDRGATLFICRGILCTSLCQFCVLFRKGRAVRLKGAVQVGVVRESEGRVFRVLSTDEVEDHLTAISERD